MCDRQLLTSTLIFHPMRPSLHSETDLYRVDGYLVQSCLEGDTVCKVVGEKELQEGEELGVEESVEFPLRLSNVEKTCQYTVVLHYVNSAIGGVKSEVYEVKVDAVGE